MGKKGRKTRWRRLPIGESKSSNFEGGPESSPATAETRDSAGPPSPEHRITFNEDEYTKITTPRQDVLFKKGYLGRRRTTNSTETPEVHSADSVESNEYIPEEQPQFAYLTPGGFIDQNGLFYMNSSGYELYDPYTGNITVVVGPAPQYPPQPILAAMPCQPVPLTPLEWFNPPQSWACPYSNNSSRRKRYSTDSQNCSAQSSESTGPPGSPQEQLDALECASGAGGPVFPPQPPPYVYPGYMFGAPLYNMNGVSVQGVVPQSPVPPSDLSAAKRRKKRRRKRRGGMTDEGSESSCEEVLGCDTGVCSQSGASSDAGQGSSCSKTNSDSGINTEPTPDSGTNTPPLPADDDRLHLPTCDCVPDDEEPCDSADVALQSEPDRELEVEPISSSVSTPEALKHTLESLPSEDGETLQELSCSSEPSDSKLLSCCSETAPCDSFEPIVTNPVPSSPEQNETVAVSCTLCPSEITSEDSVWLAEQPNEIVEPEVLSKISDSNEAIPVSSTDLVSLNEVNNEEKRTELSLTDVEEEVIENFIIEEKEVEHQENEEDSHNDHCELILENTRPSLIVTNDDQSIEIECVNEEEELVAITERLSVEEPTPVTAVECCHSQAEEESRSIDDDFSLCLSRFSSCTEMKPPVPPPRRKRSLSRAAEKVAAKVVDEAVREAVKEAAHETCCRQYNLPITEAVTRWLQSQGPATVLTTPGDTDTDNDDVDEGIEDGEGSTNQKNVEGNPFLAPYLSGSRTRVADTDECASMISSAGEWDMYDHHHSMRAICDPAASVEKYYRLGAEDPEEKQTGAGTNNAPSTMIKTAVHIRRAGPFPCGVCCIIQ